MWWLVSPQNPLKVRDGMAPLAARLASAAAATRHPRLRALALEAAFGTRYTVDTVRQLQRRYPAHRFIWLMGADNLSELHRWHRWRDLARAVPIAVFSRPGYGRRGSGAPAMAWLRRWRRRGGGGRDWTRWTPPAIVLLDIRLDHRSATAIRARDPDWANRRHERTA